jgi:hypothetical protein
MGNELTNKHRYIGGKTTEKCFSDIILPQNGEFFDKFGINEVEAFNICRLS